MAKDLLSDLLKEQKKQTKLLKEISVQNKQLLKIKVQPLNPDEVLDVLEDTIMDQIVNELN